MLRKTRTASLSASGSLLVCVHLQLLEGALERDAREDQQAAVFGARCVLRRRGGTQDHRLWGDEGDLS